MFCRNCGSNMPDGCAFCSVCGLAMNSGSAPAPGIKPCTPKKLNTKALISAVLLIAIIGLSVFAYLNYFDGRKDGESIPVMFWVLCGIVLILTVALVVTMLSKKNSSDIPPVTVSTAYNLPINPMTPTADVVDSTDVHTIDTNQQYDVTTVETSATTVPHSTEPIHADSQTDFNAENIYKDLDDIKTKYAPKKDVEIVFSPEVAIPALESDVFSFVPASADKPEIPADSEPGTPDEITSAAETSAACEVVSEPEISASADVSAAKADTLSPETPAITETPAMVDAPGVSEPKPKKPSSSPFFKSAGDL